MFSKAEICHMIVRSIFIKKTFFFLVVHCGKSNPCVFSLQIVNGTQETYLHCGFLPTVRHLEYLAKILPRSCQAFPDLLPSSAKIFEEIQEIIEDLVRIFKMKSKILQEIQDRFQEYICRTCGSPVSDASRN